ncbi:MAG: alginate export family protein [Bacteroidales bacterium]|nr:alginate export family protein [Bacteroidales bacterium]
MKKGLLLLGLMIGFIMNLSAQFTLSGELRPRLELRHGYSKLPNPDDDMAAFISQRSRINLLYEDEKYSAFVRFQQVGVWGNVGTLQFAPSIGLHQAYVDVKLCPQFSIKAGRQELVYDNQRLFSLNNWRQPGRSHDAVVLKYQENDWKLHLGGAFNQSNENVFGTLYDNTQPEIAGNYKSLSYLWINRKISNFQISGLAVMDGFQQLDPDTATNLRFITGGSVVRQSKLSKLELYAYYQGGKTQAGRDISAWYVNFSGGIKPNDKINLTAGIEIFSGNDFTRQENEFKAFNPLYGANHGYNGHLDYFTNIPNHTKGAGLINPYFKVNFPLNNKIILNADYHYFALQNNLVDNNNQTLDKYLASEIDLSMQYNISDQAIVHLGYSSMLATESMEFLKGGSHKEPIHWAWVMLTVKPVFFTTKN